MNRALDFVGVILAALFSAYVLWYEINQPVQALRFIALTHQIDPKVCLLMAPWVLAFAISLCALIMAFRAFRRSKIRTPWVWIAVADGLGPVLGLIGQAVAIHVWAR